MFTAITLSSDCITDSYDLFASFMHSSNLYMYVCIYRKSAKVRVKNVHFLNFRVKKYSRSQDSYVLQCILLKTFVRLMFAVLAIRELFLTVNFCRFTVCTYSLQYI